MQASQVPRSRLRLALTRVPALLALATAVVAELLFARALFAEALTAASVLHAACVAGACAGSWLLLDGLDRRARRDAALAAACITLTLPAMGLLGLLAVALPRWCRRAEAQTIKLIERPMPRYTDEVLGERAPSLPTTDALSPTCPLDARITAVKALRNMEATRAIPLLRRALSDPAEDVRLLAHAILDRRERGIRAQLEASLARLAEAEAEAASSPKRRRAHAELASHYWELVYAGFVGGESARITLAKAAEHALAAAQYPGERTTGLIAVRAYLRLGKLDAAQATLDWAREVGVPEAVLAPLSAELAFLAGRYGQIDEALAPLSPLSSNQPRMGQVARYWGARGASRS